MFQKLKSFTQGELIYFRPSYLIVYPSLNNYGLNSNNPTLSTTGNLMVDKFSLLTFNPAVMT